MTTIGPPLGEIKGRADDLHEEYLDAVYRWEEADKEHHRCSIGVACGRITAEELGTAAARLSRAENTAMIERHRAGRRWFTGLRYCTEDDELRLAVETYVEEVCRRVIDPLRAENAELRARVADLEEAAVGRGVAA